ncbi:glutaredoxin [Dispira parvispora]|uniref:Glutaredoxin n=1 Tax=Dispira parvispora TaxID=1520584 RepID=A0A9W8EA78_9FUNG|nr:glutaredoxin [Dispira parvispora]
MSPNYLELKDEQQLYRLLRDQSQTTVVLFFTAQWSPQCQQMDPVFTALASKYSDLQFVKVEAESFETVSESYEISAVPSFVFVSEVAIVDRVDGANAPELTRLVEKHHRGPAPSGDVPAAEAVKTDLNTRLKELTHRSPVMIFIKGTPTQPRCGFSRQLVQLLDEREVKYGYFDILSDEEVRQGLKQFSSWPTYPQLYTEGELLGGLDIIKEMIQSGEFMESLPANTKA